MIYLLGVVAVILFAISLFVYELVTLHKKAIKNKSNFEEMDMFPFDIDFEGNKIKDIRFEKGRSDPIMEDGYALIAMWVVGIVLSWVTFAILAVIFLFSGVKTATIYILNEINSEKKEEEK
jgi:uncharacterized membrane protein YjfL (UPF0719 family)